MGYSDSDVAYEREVNTERTRTERDKLKKLLIEACDSLERKGFIKLVCKELKDWWCEEKVRIGERLAKENHKKRQDQLRQSGLSKLTQAERKVLGLP